MTPEDQSPLAFVADNGAAQVVLVLARALAVAWRARLSALSSVAAYVLPFPYPVATIDPLMTSFVNARDQRRAEESIPAAVEVSALVTRAPRAKRVRNDRS